MNGKWFGAGEDSDMFRLGPCDSALEAAELAAEGEDVGAIVQAGRLRCHIPFLNANWVIEHLQEQAGDECGEVSEDWDIQSVSDDAVKELDSALELVIDGWLHKHGVMPTFGTIEDVERFECRGDRKVKPIGGHGTEGGQDAQDVRE